MWCPSQTVRELQDTRDQLMKLREERSNTSSQDNFAKWARLDREFQKVKKVYDAKTGEVAAARQSLSSTIRILKWVLSTGLNSVVMIYYRKQPVVWLPYGLLPKWAERIVALPSAPLGSVSASFWVLAVNSMLDTSLNFYRFLRSKGK